MQDNRVETYMNYRDMVFGDFPTRDAIPSAVLRDYLDVQVEMARARRGIDDTLLAMTIPQIKTKARLIYVAERAKDAKEKGR